MNEINIKDVTNRLLDFGVSVSDSDLTTIELVCEGTREYILNYCNIDYIPVELYFVAVDICCGTFLKTKASVGALSVMEGNNLSSLTEGDVSIGFREGTSSCEIMMDTINELLNKKGELVCYRKLKW